jgi:hypothetical protein
MPEPIVMKLCICFMPPEGISTTHFINTNTAPSQIVILLLLDAYIYIYIYIFSLALQPPWALASDFQFRDHFTDGRTPWTSDQLIARPLPKHRIDTYTYQTSMLYMGFEPTIPASERAKTVHALDRSATVTGAYILKFLSAYI